MKFVPVFQTGNNEFFYDSVSSLSYLDKLDSITAKLSVGMLSAYIKNPDELYAVRATKITLIILLSVSPKAEVRTAREGR